ncbi:hypothetical protein AXFE_33900 [Acidithrix ferrooxidans]|uniref:Uncharacterized protein n=1 Tax=Acidithrix ferrooxidans TaxID=1280514 RepID=A0A0D8HCS5_9ACTN|nr:hypothetical protein AXFE_33900 [Acidithrix ferrooxidans]
MSKVVKRRWTSDVGGTGLSRRDRRRVFTRPTSLIVLWVVAFA